MAYQVGDKVIHWNYGLGEITHIEEKTIGSMPTNCYVMSTPDLTIWVPIDAVSQHNLRTPTPASEFSRVYALLQSPGESLLADRVQRKSQLLAQMNDGTLLSVCRVIRDLTHYKQENKLNDNEKSILDRATKSLLAEWSYSLQVTVHQAQEALTGLMAQPPQQVPQAG